MILDFQKKDQKCICIKDGYMKSDMAGNRGSQFCIEGKVYRYAYTKTGGYPFNVETEKNSSHSHSMGSNFFHTYFQPWDDTILNDDLFEI